MAAFNLPPLERIVKKGGTARIGISSLEDEIFAYEEKMGVTIRRATIADLDTLTRLWKELADYHADLAPEFALVPQATTLFSNHLSDLVQDQDCCILLAEDEGTAVGFISGVIRENPPIFSERRVGHISNALITARLRRRGIGARLVSAMRDWFRERGVRYIDLGVAAANTLGIEFWHNMGFQDSMTRMRGEVK